MQLVSPPSHSRVGLVSTEPIRLAGICGAFESHTSIRIVFGDLEAILSDTSLHCLIADSGYDPNWLDLQARLQVRRPDMRRIVLGPLSEDLLVLRCLEGGARGFLDLNAGPLAIRQAVEGVLEGMIWAPRRILSMMIDRLMVHQQQPQLEPILSRIKPTYSPRERQVLELIMTASSNREIAEKLGIEERTVKAYVASLMRKSGVDNRVSLSVRATQESMRLQRMTS